LRRALASSFAHGLPEHARLGVCYRAVPSAEDNVNGAPCALDDGGVGPLAEFTEDVGYGMPLYIYQRISNVFL